MDPESEIYVDTNNAISLIIFPKKEEEVVVNKIHAEGFKKISEEDFFNRRIRFEDENYTFYGANNEKLIPKDALNKFKSGMYKVDAYCDDNNQFKLAYIIRMTQEQMNQGMEEAMKMQNDFEAKLKGNPFPEFTLTDLSGTTHTSESIKGKVVVINLWFTACAPCIHEMPELNKIVDAYKENEGVLFLAFALDPKPLVDKFLKKHKFDYNIIPESQEYITKKLNPPGYPTHIVLDKNSNVLMLGITFKENCPDIRNTRAIDVYEELQSYNVNVDVYDPWADSKEVKAEFGFNLIENPKNKYHAVILTVAHKEFLNQDLRSQLIDGGILYDVKGILDTKFIDARL